MIHLLDNWKSYLDVTLHCTCFSFYQLCDNRVRSFIFTHPALSLTNTPLGFASFFFLAVSDAFQLQNAPEILWCWKGTGNFNISRMYSSCAVLCKHVEPTLVSSYFASKETFL